jgi:hypothetical protein
MSDITFEVPCTWPVGLLPPEQITYKGKCIKVAGSTPTGIVLVLHMELAPKEHHTAVQEWIEGKPAKPPKDVRVEMPLDTLDLETMQPQGLMVWDSLFKKPEPVVDMFAWAESPLADQFIYLPNSIRKQGVEAEEYITNAHYTEVLTNAYRKMCEAADIKPVALLEDGVQQVMCWRVQPYDGSQASFEGARSARLANSRLYDFDDSAYAKLFIKTLIELKPFEYESEPVLRTVLAKAEHILMGRTSHTYNQKFIKRFMGRLTDTDPSLSERVLNILSGMITEGLVLEDSFEQFKARVIRGRLDADLDFLLQAFGACHGE